MTNLKLARVAKGLKMSELGEMVGVSGGSISQYESGDRNPRREILERLASVLEVSTDYLLGKENDPVQIDMDRVDKVLLKELQDITPSERQKLLAFIAGLKANRAE